jgi:hypothetical protein
MTHQKEGGFAGHEEAVSEPGASPWFGPTRGYPRKMSVGELFPWRTARRALSEVGCE